MNSLIKRLLALWGVAVLLAPMLVLAFQDPKNDDDQDEDEMEEEDDPGARWEYFYDQRAFPGETIPAGARLAAYRRVKEMEDGVRSGKFPRRAAAAEATWKMIGPAPIQFSAALTTSGRVNSIAIDPRDKNVVYLAAADGGVWKTTDGGSNWKPLTDDQASLASGAVALDPSNPDTVYVEIGRAHG